jgi:hypothetical protein
MAHDWSGLLFEIEALSARRAALADRRGRGTAPAASQWCRSVGQGTGTALRCHGNREKKAAAGASSPQNEPTIASILQAPASSQQGVIALVGCLDGGGNREDEDELRTSAGGGGGGGSAATAPAAPRQAAMGRASAETVSRAAIAAGAQPVVIKVTSTVSSRASAAGLMTYLGTREVETEKRR